MAKEIAIKIKVEGKEVANSSAELDLFRKNVELLKDELEALGTRTEENADAFDKLRGDIDALESAFTETTTEVNTNTESLNTNVVATDDASTATKSYTAQIKALQVQLISLGERNSDNAEEFDKLTANIKQLKDKQEDLQFGTMKLDDALSNLPGPIGKVGQAMGLYERSIGSAKSAMKSLGLGFKTLDMALKTTLIGAVVAILITLVAAAKKAFESFKPLQDAVTRLNVAFSLVYKVVEPLVNLIGKGLTAAIDAFSYALAYLTNNLDEYKQKVKEQEDLEKRRMDRIEKDANLMVKTMGEIDNALAIASSIYQKKLAEIEKQGTSDINEIKKEGYKKIINEVKTFQDEYSQLLQKHQDELNLLAKDDIEGRRELEKKQYEESIQFGKQYLSNVKSIEQEITDGVNQEREKQAEAYKDYLNRLLKLQNENKILKLESDKKFGQEELKQQEKILIEKLDQQYAAQIAEINALEDLNDKKKQILRDQTKANYDLQKTAIEQSTLKAIDESNQEIIDKTEDINAELLLLEEDRLKKQEDLRHERAKEALNATVADAKEIDAAIEAEKSLHTANLAKIEKDAADKRKEQADKDAAQRKKDDEDELNRKIYILQTQLEGLVEGTDAYYAKQKELRDAAMRQELEATELTQQEKLDILEKYRRLDELAEQEKVQRILAGITTTMSTMSSFMSSLSESITIQAANDQKALEDSYNKGLMSYDEYQKRKEAIDKKALEKQKKIKKAMVIMDAAQAVIATWAGYASMSIFGTVLAALQTAFIIATAATQISNINNAESGSLSGGETPGTPAAPPPASTYGKLYAKGGVIEGPPHAAGGVLVNAEGGEAVMNKNSTAMFKPLLSMMNEAGGGTSFKDNLFTSFDNPVLVNPNAQSQQLITKTFVVSTDMTSEQEKQARLKALSTI